MNTKNMKIHVNAIIDRLNLLEKSNDIEANKKTMNQIHAAADEIMELVDHALMKLK